MRSREKGTGLLLGWLWRGYVRAHLPLLSLSVLLMIANGSMAGLISYIVKPMFDEVFVAGDRAAVPWIAAVITGIFLVKAISGFGQRFLTNVVGQRIGAAMQRDMLAHMLTLDSTWFQANSPGGLIERVRGDTTALQHVWNALLSKIGRDVVALVSLLAVVLSINWVWALIALAGGPLLVLPVTFFHRQVRRTSRKARAAAGTISTRLDEIFHGVNSIKLNTAETRDSDRFAAAVRKFLRSQIRAGAGQAAIPALVDVAAGIGLVAVVFYGGLQIVDGEATLGEFMAFFTAMALSFDPLRRLGNALGFWQVAVASLERIHDVFDARPTILSPARPRPVADLPAQADITLGDVHFRYDSEAPVLAGVSLTAPAGQTTALVGPSGAGKSTIFHLLTRLVEPQSGSIRIGGIDVRDFALEDLRGLFSVVSQDTALFDETMRDNILYGRPDADEAALARAIEAANLSEVIARLPEGLETPVGPRGSNLSGGQRQRVAIARAVLRDAPILLMDEPTSALDAHAEREVQKALDRLAAGRTTLVIAHRLSTVRDAARIVVMDRGRVVDTGRHEELLARDGVYAGLHQMQFRGT